MSHDRLGRGIKWNAIVEGEANTPEQWKEIIKKWNPFNIELVRILDKLGNEERRLFGENMARENAGDSNDETYLQFLVDLSFLSDEAWAKLIEALD